MSHRAVIVLGMHRSGTSCLAGSLQARGLELGAVSTNDPHNRKGNRESLEIREINEDVLRASGGSWRSPPARLHWDDDLCSRRDRTLARQAAAGSPWGFKDPRTLLTLPFWREALAEPRFVGTFRHPLAVAESLRQRDGWSLDAGVDLWVQYNQRLVAAWRAEAFPVVAFDLEAEAYRRRVDAVAPELGLPGRSTEADFRDDHLIHHGARRSPVALDPPVETLWRTLNEMAETP